MAGWSGLRWLKVGDKLIEIQHFLYEWKVSCLEITETPIIIWRQKIITYIVLVKVIDNTQVVSSGKVCALREQKKNRFSSSLKMIHISYLKAF